MCVYLLFWYGYSTSGPHLCGVYRTRARAAQVIKKKYDKNKWFIEKWEVD